MPRRIAFLVLVAFSVGCRHDPNPGGHEAAADAAPKTGQLPPLRLTDETKDVLLTWIDGEGDFHVVRKIQDVPEKNRDQVRVVVTTRRAGTTDVLYVADLRKKNADGAYPVKTLSRSQWEELGAQKRKKRMESLAASAAPPTSAAAPSAKAKSGSPSGKVPSKSGSGIVAIVYGAEWCGPCHRAREYLQSRGATVVYKDIDKNELARREMQQKLHKTGRMGASIPIIDVAGQLLVGYSPGALERALKAARQAKQL